MSKATQDHPNATGTRDQTLLLARAAAYGIATPAPTWADIDAAHAAMVSRRQAMTEAEVMDDIRHEFGWG